MCVCVCVSACARVCTYVCVCMYVYACVRVCALARTQVFFSPSCLFFFSFLLSPVLLVCLFLIHHRDSYFPSSWMVHARGAFVSGVHPSRT